MKLTKKDILNIDRYLIKKGIKHIDVRYELIDHLVSEYESMNNYPDLESFLRKRVSWCRKVSCQKEKAVHWGGQKALLKRVLSFLNSPIFYAALAMWFFFLLYLEKEFGKGILLSTLFCFLSIIMVFQYADFVYHRIRSKKESQILSAAILINIYSLPNTFLYFITPFQNQLDENIVLAGTYFTFGIMINIAALLEVHFRRRSALNQYDFLRSSML